MISCFPAVFLLLRRLERFSGAAALLILCFLGFSPAPAFSDDAPSASVADPAAPISGVAPSGSVSGFPDFGEGEILAPPQHSPALHDASAQPHAEADAVPHPIWTAPFIVLLLSIALLPLIPSTAGWWHHNTNKLIVAVTLGVLTLLYYQFRGYGFHHAAAGIPTVLTILEHALIVDYFPFIVLLFSLFTISGGIYIGASLPAHPLTNAGLILIGACLASFIGTTGASMLLIRPLLQLNQYRRHVAHTIVFFIFLVSNVGGLLLPIGDPPLFLGYLRGVPFLWTLHLLPHWLVTVGLVLGLYWIVDSFMYRRETPENIHIDETAPNRFVFRGGYNFILLLGVILAVALLVPGRELPFTGWAIPEAGPLSHLREFVQLGLAGLSVLITSADIRKMNAFSFTAIGEVAALFIGIFITMQVPIEILNARGDELGLHSPMQFFWATGALSSFLDNAPTYVVFFQTAGALHENGMPLLGGVATATGEIPAPLLVAVSLGAVFMGSMTYIGNGPNFMVKSIAEAYGIKMPSFFGYIVYSLAFLAPVFALVTWLFLA